MLKLSDALTGWGPAERGAPSDPILLLEAGWSDIVGPEVAQNSHPERIAAGTLTIVTRSSAWSHQLSFLGEHIANAVAARLPGAGIERLRFRVGRLPTRRPSPSARPRGGRARAPLERAESSSTKEALERFKSDVERHRRSRRAEGWKECRGCGALLAAAAEPLCQTCESARSRALGSATARVLFEAPWLGYTGTAALVDGLQEKEYERLRRQMLAHWWGILVRARNAKRLSCDGRERLVASSYVLLRSKLPPESIVPATVRSILGDELHELLYGGTAGEGGVAERQKRRV
ncbi:MAG TPA: DUF721 domain-containing protein [Candidatus Cybelea sp.]|jgi:hypothetical protein|nr:DUF721 domain-containing protein [Candidatus Cybelea sp.]